MLRRNARATSTGNAKAIARDDERSDTQGLIQGVNPLQRRAYFPETCWSVVLIAAHDGQPQSRGAVAELCQSYWYPVFAFLRRQGHSTDSAQDLAQGFFLHMLEQNRFVRADRLKGTFRSFLIGCLKHFAANERERSAALKRGGAIHFVTFDLEDAEYRYRTDIRSSTDGSPDHCFDRTWAQVITDKALDRVRAGFAGDERRYERLKPYLLAGEGATSYESAAQDLHVSVPLVKSAIHRLRREYRDAVRAEIAATVSAPHQVDDEIRHLIGVLSGD